MLCSTALDSSRDEIAEAVRAFIAAYRDVPHDEAFTWWTARATVARLRERGEEDLADELQTLLDTRMARIARAFQATTADEAARSNAAREASSR